MTVCSLYDFCTPCTFVLCRRDHSVIHNKIGFNLDSQSMVSFDETFFELFPRTSNPIRQAWTVEKQAQIDYIDPQCSMYRYVKKVRDPALQLTMRDHATYPSTFLTYLYRQTARACGGVPFLLKSWSWSWLKPTCRNPNELIQIDVPISNNGDSME